MQKPPGMEPWTGFFNYFITSKKSKHFVKNKSFEDFTTKREREKWTIAFQNLFVLFYYE